MRTLNILLKGIAVFLFLLSPQTNNYAKSNDGDDNKKKKSEATKTHKKVLKEGVDDLLYNPNLFRPTYDESPDVMGQNCKMKARFKMKMKGKTVQFKNTSETAYTHVEWRFGDGTLSHDSFTTEHTYEKGGNYYFSVMIYNVYTGCLDSFTGSYYIFDQDAQRAKMREQRRKMAAKK